MRDHEGICRIGGLSFIPYRIVTAVMVILGSLDTQMISRTENMALEGRQHGTRALARSRTDASAVADRSVVTLKRRST